MSNVIQDLERAQLRKVPRFKAGDMAGGIEAGVKALVSTLTDDNSEWRQRAEEAAKARAEAASPTLVQSTVTSCQKFASCSAVHNASDDRSSASSR